MAVLFTPSKDAAQPVNLWKRIETHLVFRTYPTPAPGDHHRPRGGGKKSTPGPQQDPPTPLHPTPDTLDPQEPTDSQLAVKPNRRVEPPVPWEPAAGSKLDYITAEQLHVGRTHQDKCSQDSRCDLGDGSRRPPQPTCDLMSDHPQTTAAFPTRCSAQLAEVLLLLGAVLLLGFAVFFCLHGQSRRSEQTWLPVHAFQCKGPTCETRCAAESVKRVWNDNRQN